MATYYIDPNGGRPDFSGQSEAEPRDTNRGLDIQPGDTVLFKRGSLIRDALWNVDGEAGRPVTYGAYGEGENPVFSGAVDVSAEEDWIEEAPCVWRCAHPLPTEVCNFVFDGQEGGALRWEKDELTQRGDWWDSGFGCGALAPEAHTALLYCEEHPARAFHHIECVLCVHRSLAKNGHDMNYENLTFRDNGIHAIAGSGESRNLHVRNCRFEFIGGCVWNKELKIRFGNGVECWNVAENVIVEDCVFIEIYDSGVTHQGAGSACIPAQGFIVRNNLFLRCGMAAYEQRDALPLDAEFTGNVCADAGRGFSHRHIDLPRQSEIWPQPMGHHVFLWRIDQPTPGARFALKHNVFCDAPFGAAIYSIICEEAERQTEIDENSYVMPERALLNRLFGRDFTDFDTYVAATGKDRLSKTTDLK